MHSDDSSITAFRAVGETPVPFSDALDEWATAAREVLIETARAYGAFITQAELASKVQTDTGIRAGGPVRLWIDDLLAAVTRARAEDEPLLAALCVRLDQSVGDAYPKVLEVAGFAKPDDADADAAHRRFACYQYFGAKVPAGARAMLTPRVAEKRAAIRPAKAAKTPKAAKPKTPKAASTTGSATKPAKAAKPKAAAKPKPEPVPEEKPKLCPTCYTVLSTSGVCGFCY